MLVIISNNKNIILRLYNNCDTIALKIFAKQTNIKNLKLILVDTDTFPSEISNFKNLKELDLSNNCFIRLPTGINKLSNLKTLDLSDNHCLNINSVLLKLSNMDSLKTLIMSNNNICDLNNSRITNSNIEYLDLSQNKLRSLPNLISYLPKLKILILSSNLFTSMIYVKNIKIDFYDNPINLSTEFGHSNGISAEQKALDFIIENMDSINLISFKKDANCNFYYNTIVDNELPRNKILDRGWQIKKFISPKDINLFKIDTTNLKNDYYSIYLSHTNAYNISSYNEFINKTNRCDIFIRIYKKFLINEKKYILARIYNTHERGEQSIMFKFKNNEIEKFELQQGQW